MSLLSIIIAFIIIGVLLWAVNEFMPIDPKMKRIISVVIGAFLLIVVVILLFSFLGGSTNFSLR